MGKIGKSHVHKHLSEIYAHSSIVESELDSVFPGFLGTIITDVNSPVVMNKKQERLPSSVTAKSFSVHHFCFVQ